MKSWINGIDFVVETFAVMRQRRQQTILENHGNRLCCKKLKKYLFCWSVFDGASETRLDDSPARRNLTSEKGR